ncbi:hypothetical protein [Nonomuraea recticatena]|uniref:hypothetical protein n=1 Tax=Nonomuraea recticatena TaxID=46178 RepID=UPI003622513E
MLRLVLAVCLLLHGGPAPTRDSRDTVGYWSRERIVNARPADLLPFPRLDVAPPDSAPPEVPLGYGARRTVPGRKVLTPGGDRLGYSLVDRPYTGAHRLAGILLSHDPVAGTDIACGAAVIRSRSRSLVLTAAHCLYAGGRPFPTWPSCPPTTPWTPAGPREESGPRCASGCRGAGGNGPTRPSSCPTTSAWQG